MEKLFLDKVLSLGIDVQLSMYYDKKNSQEVIKELTYNIGNSGATIKTSNANAQDIEIIGNVYSDAKYIRKSLQVGDENLFYLTIYVGTYAYDEKTLETNLERIESALIGCNLTTIRANYRQEEALRAIMPFLENDLDIEKMASRNVLTSGLTATYPFNSNELFDKDGVLIGVNSFDKSIIMLDRFNQEKYKNANMFVLGTSGSGKSYFIKLMIERNRFLNYRQFVIDPDREYSNVCKAVGGALINFGTSQMINIFDIRETDLEIGETYLRNKISKLNIFFPLIFPNMNEEEASLLESSLIKCYYQQGITEDNETLYKSASSSKLLQRKVFKDSCDMPKIENFYEIIKKDKKLKKFATMLKPYVSGSMAYLNNYTNIDTDNKLVVVDIHDVSEHEMPIVMFVITDYFWDIIKKNREQKKIIYFDEVWKMINKNEQTADFIFKLFKTIRKFGGSATAITQDVSDFFMLEDGKYGKGILNNSNIKCIFQLEENDIQILSGVVNLSDEEKYQILNMKRGRTIIHAGRNSLMCDVISSEKEKQIIDGITAFSEEGGY